MSDDITAYDEDAAWLEARVPGCTEQEIDQFSNWVTRLFNDDELSIEKSRDLVFGWMFKK